MKGTEQAHRRRLALQRNNAMTTILSEAYSMETTSIPGIGIALSGGGARGLAHLGLLQVLEEAQIPVAMLAGTSMGGLVAGLYAAGVPLGYLIAFARRAGIMDLAAPDRAWRGLFGHDKVARILANLLGSPTIAFEDLRIPTAVVAADVETGEQVVLDQGPLIPALLATSAFPLVFAPVRHQGRWLVDGGVVNNLPVDIVRQMGADRVLGICTPPSVKLDLRRKPKKTGLSPRGLYRLNNHTRDWKLPFLIAEASFGISVQVANRARLVTCPPDLLIEIHLPNVGVFSSNGIDEIIEMGRRTALEHLGELVALKGVPSDDQLTLSSPSFNGVERADLRRR
jgi:NTE family protein